MTKEELNQLVEQIKAFETDLFESEEKDLDDNENDPWVVEETTQFDKYLKGVVLNESARGNKKLVTDEPNREYYKLYREKFANRIKF